jgi:muconate cycloisomerase
MRVVRIETIPVSVPLHPDRILIFATATHARSPFLIVRVHTDEGLVGLGEVSCTPRWSGEDSVTAAHVVSTYLAPRVLGEDPREVERLGLLLDDAIVGHHFTKAAVEMALWDIRGKAAGLPVHRLLGGPVRPRIRTKFSVGGAEPERAAAVAAWAVEQGFAAMKVKVGIDLAGDLRRVAAVREAVGDAVLLGVDANTGWTRAEAASVLAPLAELRVAFIEQPLDRRDLPGMAELRRRATVPIVADEPVGTPEDALAVVRAEAADILSVYAGMAGGLAPARRVAAIAVAAGCGWTIGSNLELGVALAAHIHLASSTPGLDDDRVPCDILSPFYYEDDLLTTPLPVEAGWAAPPEGPGLGVELDEEKLERYREDR